MDIGIGMGRVGYEDLSSPFLLLPPFSTFFTALYSILFYSFWFFVVYYAVLWYVSGERWASTCGTYFFIYFLISLFLSYPIDFNSGWALLPVFWLFFMGFDTWYLVFDILHSIFDTLHSILGITFVVHSTGMGDTRIQSPLWDIYIKISLSSCFVWVFGSTVSGE